MKLVTDFSSVHDAEEASALLEANGIATFITSKRSIRIPKVLGGAPSVGLWVTLDTQLADARQLLRDPAHKVEHRLSSSEMIQIRQSVHSNDYSALLRFLFAVLGLVAFFGLVVDFLTKR